jgi:hypothetical protein
MARVEPFAQNVTVGGSWHIPKLLPAASRRRLRKNSTPIPTASATDASACAPASDGFCPPVTPHDRRRRFRPDADPGALVGVGAIGNDAVDEMLGRQHRRSTWVPFSPAALTRRSANDAILALIIHRWTHENWLEQYRYLNMDDLREPKPNEHLCAETRISHWCRGRSRVERRRRADPFEL